MAIRQTSRMKSFFLHDCIKGEIFVVYEKQKKGKKNYDEVSIVTLTSNFIANFLLLLKKIDFKFNLLIFELLLCN